MLLQGLNFRSIVLYEDMMGGVIGCVVWCDRGVYGLWLDGDLYHGRTQWCVTYDNDLLTASEDFMIKCLEVWTFT